MTFKDPFESEEPHDSWLSITQKQFFNLFKQNNTNDVIVIVYQASEHGYTAFTYQLVYTGRKTKTLKLKIFGVFTNISNKVRIPVLNSVQLFNIQVKTTFLPFYRFKTLIERQFPNSNKIVFTKNKRTGKRSNTINGFNNYFVYDYTRFYFGVDDLKCTKDYYYYFTPEPLFIRFGLRLVLLS